MVKPPLPLWSVKGLCSYIRLGICASCSADSGGVGVCGSPLSSADFLLGFEVSWIFGGRPPVVSGYHLWGTEASRCAGDRPPVVSLGELILGNRYSAVRIVTWENQMSARRLTWCITRMLLLQPHRPTMSAWDAWIGGVGLLGFARFACFSSCDTMKDCKLLGSEKFMLDCGLKISVSYWEVKGSSLAPSKSLTQVLLYLLTIHIVSQSSSCAKCHSPWGLRAPMASPSFRCRRYSWVGAMRHIGVSRSHTRAIGNKSGTSQILNT